MLLKDQKDLRCSISEPATGEVVETFPISMSVKSVFSRFRLQPGRGITFGAVKFNQTPPPRKFELKNEGQFAFTFAVTSQEIAANCRKAIVAATPPALIAPEYLSAVVAGDERRPRAGSRTPSRRA